MLKRKVIGLAIATFFFFFLIAILIFVGIFFSDEDEGNPDSLDTPSGANVSAEVLAYAPLVQKYCKEFGIEKYVNYILAIMQVESGGKVADVMQCSESLGLPPNTLGTEASIKQGCFYFAQLLKEAETEGCDVNTAIQSYNYGGGFINHVIKNGKKYTLELAISFAREKSGGSQVPYSDPIAKEYGGWRYKYGNMFYVPLVLQYITTSHFGNKTAQAIMDEALKYLGYPYVFGGSNPDTSFDCSGLTQWCYRAAGINLPRTAQEQYEATQHIPLTDAKAGDLVFFKGTYDTANFITHVGIYVGNNRMYHAGDPIGYADLTTSYWQEHLVSVGRIKQN